MPLWIADRYQAIQIIAQFVGGVCAGGGFSMNIILIEQVDGLVLVLYKCWNLTCFKYFEFTVFELKCFDSISMASQTITLPSLTAELLGNILSHWRVGSK